MTANVIFTVSESTTELGAHSRHKELVAGLTAKYAEVVWIGPDPGIAGVRCVPVSTNAGSWIGRNLTRLTMASLLARELEKAGSKTSTVFSFSDMGLAVAYWARRKTSVAADFVHFQRAESFAIQRFLVGIEQSISRRIRLRLVQKALERLYIRSGRAGFRFVVQCETHADRLARLMGQSKIGVLPNNCNPSWLNCRSESSKRPATEFRLLLIANIHEKGKGIDVALDAMRHLDSTFSLTIVGDGPDIDQIRTRAASLPKVHVAGRIPDAASMMPDFDCLLVPTRIDAYPNVVLEGLAQRIPIIASEIEAHREILGPDHPLIPHDGREFARQIALLAEEPATREDLLAIQEPRRDFHTFDWVERAAELLNGAPGSA